MEQDTWKAWIGWFQISWSTQDLWLCACSEWRFHCCHTEAAWTFFTRSGEQGLQECWSYPVPLGGSDTGRWLAAIPAFFATWAVFFVGIVGARYCIVWLSRANGTVRACDLSYRNMGILHEPKNTAKTRGHHLSNLIWQTLILPISSRHGNPFLV